MSENNVVSLSSHPKADTQRTGLIAMMRDAGFPNPEESVGRAYWMLSADLAAARVRVLITEAGWGIEDPERPHDDFFAESRRSAGVRRMPEDYPG